VIRRALVVLGLLGAASCVRDVVLEPAPDAGVPDGRIPDGDVPPDTNGTLPDAAVGD